MSVKAEKALLPFTSNKKEVITPLYLLAVPNSYNDKSILSGKKTPTQNLPLPATKVSSVCRALLCLWKAKGLTLSPSSLFSKLVRTGSLRVAVNRVVIKAKPCWWLGQQWKGHTCDWVHSHSGLCVTCKTQANCNVFWIPAGKRRQASVNPMSSCLGQGAESTRI